MKKTSIIITTGVVTLILIFLDQNPAPPLLVGVLVLFLIYALWNPPKKHKSLSIYDQYKATSRALGGSGPPDISQLKPISNGSKDEKKRKHT